MISPPADIWSKRRSALMNPAPTWVAKCRPYNMSPQHSASPPSVSPQAWRIPASTEASASAGGSAVPRKL